MLCIFKRGIKAHNPTVTFTPNPKATLKRKIERVKRVQISIAKAVKRGDARKAGQLQEELDLMTTNLLEEKADIEAMLRTSATK